MAEAATEEMSTAATETLNELSENALNPISGDDEGSFDSDDSGEPTSTLETDLDLEGQSEKDPSVEGADKSEGDPEKDQEGTGEGEEARKGQEGRIDKDPVFKRLHGGQQQLRADLNQLVGKIDTWMKQGGAKDGQEGGAPDSAEKKDYTDITTLSEADCDEWYETDKLGFMSNLAKQARAEAAQDVLKTMEAKGNEATVKTTVEEFAKENEGFTEMLNSGELSRFINSSQKNRVIHNVFSAYAELTKETRDTKIKTDAEKKVQKNFEAKRQQKPLRGGSAPKDSVNPLDEQLKNPEKYGGKTAVMANRLRAMRKKLSG